MKIERFILGAFGTNTYVVSNEEGQVLLVDPACSNAYEQQMLYAYITHLPAVKEVQIVATHGHLDHLWGAAWATELWKTPVRMHEADIPMVQAMQQQYDLFGIGSIPQPFPVEPFGETDFQLIHTPGHTPGSVCLYWPEERVLLSGDTLFQMGFGRTDLPGGDMGQLIDSLRRLCTLPPETVVYPGHGDETTIGAERRWH